MLGRCYTCCLHIISFRHTSFISLHSSGSQATLPLLHYIRCIFTLRYEGRKVGEKFFAVAMMEAIAAISFRYALRWLLYAADIVTPTLRFSH